MTRPTPWGVNNKQSCSRRRPPLQRAGALATITGVALLVAACSSSSSSTTPAGSAQQNAAFAFSRCMRSHGVPSFPDPGASGPAVNPRSPAFQAAQQACRQLDPKRLPPPTHPSASQRQAALRFAQCMRTHGYPNFPDPTPNLPSTASGTILGAFNVYWVLGPGTGIQAHSPAFLHAATACGVNPRGPAPR
jgi:hypothetical protein